MADTRHCFRAAAAGLVGSRLLLTAYPAACDSKNKVNPPQRTLRPVAMRPEKTRPKA